MRFVDDLCLLKSTCSPAKMESTDCVKEGDNLILKKENSLKLFKLWKKRRVFMDKKDFLLDAALGQPYGTVWEVRNNDVVQIDHSVLQAEQVDSASGGDNRNIVDDSSTQKLSREDISSLKESGHSGESIIEQLVENSASFKDKNVYSQAKYRKKKREKHLTRFQILRPSTRLLCDMYWNRAPSKIIQLRADTLAQILTAANIQSTSKVMLVESTQGLVLGAMMERMAGQGTIVQFHSEDKPVRLAVDAYNFPQSYQDTVHSLVLGNVGRLFKEINCTESPKAQESTEVEKSQVQITEKMDTESGDTKQTLQQGATCTEQSADLQEERKASDDMQKDESKTEVGSSTESAQSAKVKDQEESAMEITSREESGTEKKQGKGKRKIETPEQKEAKLERQQQRQEAFVKVKEILQQKNMDALVIVSRFQPSPILMALIELLALSRPFVVYCSNKEPLMECYLKLRERGGAISLRITETWLRNYQVLPKRTHPLVTMSGTGGYLLTGITVEAPPATSPAT
ncbi:tRNA (adenine(58)-N(1))-methyltransferase non-catalytic subunit TRM6-like [Amphiura filiformis]|uniref:tRNA (adenine(58)-N(1))-methyltransferase non-catalytic subunit TRM6-like n=1 Tax=Amphiura filiformis TaxID=82378 RepID=UPI003B21707A